MPSVLFVCTANQCRSPMAVALFERHLSRRGLLLQAEWRVASAGTWADEGIPAISKAVKVMQTMGLRIESHRSRQVSLQLLQSFDLILVMSHNQLEGLRVEFSNIAMRVELLTAMAGPSYDIPDPAGGSTEDVREIAEEIDMLLERGFVRILERVGIVHSV